MVAASLATWWTSGIDHRSPGPPKVNHDVGLAAGYLHGRVLTKNQKAIFFYDLRSRMRNRSYRGPTSKWSPRNWEDWYTESAGVFRRYHLTA